VSDATSPTVADDGLRARVAWRCRRGLLELDLWLGGFWAAQRDTLLPDEAAVLERLLALDDVDILDLLEGRALAEDTVLEALIQRLQCFREAT
jgi:antitoxin CptB